MTKPKNKKQTKKNIGKKIALAGLALMIIAIILVLKDYLGLSVIVGSLGMIIGTIGIIRQEA